MPNVLFHEMPFVVECEDDEPILTLVDDVLLSVSGLEASNRMLPLPVRLIDVMY